MQQPSTRRIIPTSPQQLARNIQPRQRVLADQAQKRHYTRDDARFVSHAQQPVPTGSRLYHDINHSTTTTTPSIPTASVPRVSAKYNADNETNLRGNDLMQMRLAAQGNNSNNDANRLGPWSQLASRGEPQKGAAYSVALPAAAPPPGVSVAYSVGLPVAAPPPGVSVGPRLPDATTATGHAPGKTAELGPHGLISPRSMPRANPQIQMVRNIKALDTDCSGFTAQEELRSLPAGSELKDMQGIEEPPAGPEDGEELTSVCSLQTTHGASSSAGAFLATTAKPPATATPTPLLRPPGGDGELVGGLEEAAALGASALKAAAAEVAAPAARPTQAALKAAAPEVAAAVMPVSQVANTELVLQSFFGAGKIPCRQQPPAPAPAPAAVPDASDDEDWEFDEDAPMSASAPDLDESSRNEGETWLDYLKRMNALADELNIECEPKQLFEMFRGSDDLTLIFIAFARLFSLATSLGRRGSDSLPGKGDKAAGAPRADTGHTGKHGHEPKQDRGMLREARAADATSSASSSASYSYSSASSSQSGAAAAPEAAVPLASSAPAVPRPGAAASTALASQEAEENKEAEEEEAEVEEEKENRPSRDLTSCDTPPWAGPAEASNQQWRFPYEQMRVLLGGEWKAKELWRLLDQRCARPEYASAPFRNGGRLLGRRVVIVGAGPVGLRTAIELCLLGARVTVVERRTRFMGINQLHVWSWCGDELKALGARILEPPPLDFGANPDLLYISIRDLQKLLIKVALLLGVEVLLGTGFVRPQWENGAWHARLEPAAPTDDAANVARGGSDQLAVPPSPRAPTVLRNMAVLIGADGFRSKVAAGIGMKMTDVAMRGESAVGITCNFERTNGPGERILRSFSLARQFFLPLFRQVEDSTGAELENMVYTKSRDAHYFIMTPTVRCLAEAGVLIDKNRRPLISRDNVDDASLDGFVRRVVGFPFKRGEPAVLAAVSEDSAKPQYADAGPRVFDFSRLVRSVKGIGFMAPPSKGVPDRPLMVRQVSPDGSDNEDDYLLTLLVGDALIESFWPEGLGVVRGFLSSLDASSAILEWSRGASRRETQHLFDAMYTHLKTVSAATRFTVLRDDEKGYKLAPATRYRQFDGKTTDWSSGKTSLP